MNQRELFTDNLRDSHWIGEVVDNKDPQQLGRCKVKVFGKFDLLDAEDIPWALAANNTHGSYNVPKVGDIVAIIFDNGNIYTPLYKYNINNNTALKDDVLSGSTEPENVISLMYDGEKNAKVFYSPGEGIIISTGNGAAGAPMVRLSEDGKVYINADDIFIASSYNDESEPAVKGETLSKILEEIVDAISNHKHIPYGGPVLPNTTIQLGLTKAKFKTFKQKR